MEEFTLETKKDLELVNITYEIEKRMDVTEGLVHVFTPHATGAIFVGEDEEGLREDYLKKFKELFPKGAGYQHDIIDNNAHSHLLSSFIGPSLIVPVKNAKLELGTWQSIFFLETDGPRPTRRIIIQVISSN